jgi:2-(1,2-epoxy-1,2-dihydrophenyl)acetyl-CoA isomerase
MTSPATQLGADAPDRLRTGLRAVPVGAAAVGREAAEAGLVNAALPRDTLMSHVEGWTRRVCALAPHVVRMTKPLMRAAADMSWHHAILTEEFAEPSTFTTRAHQEAVRGLVTGATKALG